MADKSLHLRPGTLVVMEGLDRTGKSTQISALEKMQWADPTPVFTHMPSGLTGLTQAIYVVTETEAISSPLARQLLHLACHAENIDALKEARRRRAVVLDRWWWSTLAYGWHAGNMARLGVDEAVFRGLIDTVWSEQRADVVFLFIDPHRDDDHNREEVRAAYEHLAATYPSLTVQIPRTDPATTTQLLLTHLRDRGLLG